MRPAFVYSNTTFPNVATKQDDHCGIAEDDTLDLTLLFAVTYSKGPLLLYMLALEGPKCVFLEINCKMLSILTNWQVFLSNLKNMLTEARCESTWLATLQKEKLPLYQQVGTKRKTHKFWVWKHKQASNCQVKHRKT